MALSQSNFNRAHTVCDKDVYRYLKTENAVEHSALTKKPSGVKSLLEFNNCKYKPRSQLIMEEYENPPITEDQLYVIDKVARQRAKAGRFGVDNSEILIFELEQANKERDEYLNTLVYKDSQKSLGHSNSKYRMPPSPTGIETSKILFRRLSKQGKIEKSKCSLLESARQSSSAASALTEASAPTFQ
jgi:hypothetical protein